MVGGTPRSPTTSRQARCSTGPPSRARRVQQSDPERRRDALLPLHERAHDCPGGRQYDPTTEPTRQLTTANGYFIGALQTAAGQTRYVFTVTAPACVRITDDSEQPMWNAERGARGQPRRPLRAHRRTDATRRRAHQVHCSSLPGRPAHLERFPAFTSAETPPTGRLDMRRRHAPALEPRSRRTRRRVFQQVAERPPRSQLSHYASLCRKTLLVAPSPPDPRSAHCRA